MFFVVLCAGTPEGSPGSDSGFKASQKTGQRLKVSSDRLGEAGNRTCDPWFTRHSPQKVIYYIEETQKNRLNVSFDCPQYLFIEVYNPKTSTQLEAELEHNRY